MLARPAIIVLGLLALAAGLAARLWHVLAEPLWLDEAYSAFAADHGRAFLWRVVPRYETHPPFYYSLLHLWVGLAGDGLAALRLPGIVAGLATPPLTALAADEATRAFGWSEPRRSAAALAAFAFACVAVQLVEMTRQVRPYPLMILAYAAATWLLLRIRARGVADRRLLVGHLLLLELLLWLHDLGPLYAATLTAALGLVLAGRPLGPRDRIWLLAGHALVALFYLPGLLIVARQAPTWIGSTWVHLTMPDVAGHLQMLYAAPGAGTLAALGLAATAVAAARRDGDRRVAALLLLLASGPVVLSLLVSVTIAPVFITRTVSPAAVPALLLYALGASAWDGWRRVLGLALALVLANGMAWVDVGARRAGPFQDWYGAADWLAWRVHPGDRVLAYPNEGALPLGYALRDRHLALAVEPIPAPVPAFATPGARYPTGSRGVVSLNPPHLRAVADRADLRAAPTIWLLRLGRRSYDPDDLFLHLLARGRAATGSWRSGPIEIVGLRRPERAAVPRAGSPVGPLAASPRRAPPARPRAAG